MVLHTAAPTVFSLPPSALLTPPPRSVPPIESCLLLGKGASSCSCPSPTLCAQKTELRLGPTTWKMDQEGVLASIGGADGVADHSFFPHVMHKRCKEIIFFFCLEQAGPNKPLPSILDVPAGCSL